MLNSTTEPPDPLAVDSREAAHLLSVCPKTIANLVKRGDLPAIRIGRAVRFDVRDLARLVERMKVNR